MKVLLNTIPWWSSCTLMLEKHCSNFTAHWNNTERWMTSLAWNFDVIGMGCDVGMPVTVKCSKMWETQTLTSYSHLLLIWFVSPLFIVFLNGFHFIVYSLPSCLQTLAHIYSVIWEWVLGMWSWRKNSGGGGIQLWMVGQGLALLKPHLHQLVIYPDCVISPENGLHLSPYTGMPRAESFCFERLCTQSKTLCTTLGLSLSC